MPTTVPNLSDYTDRTGTWRTPQGPTMPVKVKSARRAYGRLEFRITPINGTGEAWVKSDYVRLDEKAPDGAVEEALTQ